MSRQTVLNEIQDCGAVVILRLTNSDKILQIAEAIIQGGMKAIEVTLNTPGAIEAISKLCKTLGDKILIGAGTVLNGDEAEKAIHAGAKYVISPVFKPEIIHMAHAHDCPAVPGCMTPTEMLQAHEAGADVIKLFPAESFGPEYMRSIMAPLNHLRIMPTGGVHASNAGDWISAGAFCLGVGSAILDKKAIAANDFQALNKKARDFKEAIQHAREQIH
ncbi:bifunctional 4-hydroxy-2-oxoglutarate aldolase/2-dehydro-3-deoxy-phosphogluconate aldolase [candidate division KSB1 bacterium]|nr:bifunctional 4-hydroxy-2-oxoglutarate aldolase/2-dehydro-3-deoxy-phosphogluconate aldolase [candidate division KSB1 bacterium]